MKPIPAQAGVTILCVVGARPNFVKIAPILRALSAQPGFRPFLVHSGQHYAPEMSDSFFRDLDIPPPDAALDVGSGSHAAQTAEIMRRLEPILEAEKPACVLVVGDVNSTLAATLVAVKMGIPVAHVEAGLRSFDRSMPEEINRLLTDRVSELLFVTEESGLRNLRNEGVAEDSIFFVGNVMIDSLRHALSKAVEPAETLRAQGADPALVTGPEGYGLVTLHRPSNVDDPGRLAAILDTLTALSGDCPLVFPLHPRTRARIEAAGLLDRLRAPGIATTGPLGYLAFLGLAEGARVVVTDSGGLQEETTCLGVPCLTVRDSTERPVTVEEGTNILVGNDPAVLAAAFRKVLAGEVWEHRQPRLWDGKAAERIVERLSLRFLGEAPARQSA